MDKIIRTHFIKTQTSLKHQLNQATKLKLTRLKPAAHNTSLTYSHTHAISTMKCAHALPNLILKRKLKLATITSANNIVGGAAAPANPPATFIYFFTGIDMPSCLNHHFFDPVTRFVGDARDVGGTCGVYFARTCCKIRHFTGPAEIELHPCLNHHFFERPISRENAAKYDILGNLCSLCMSVCMHFFEHHRGSHPRQPSRCLVNSITPFLESLHPYLNHHFFRHHGGAAAPPNPPRYV